MVNAACWFAMTIVLARLGTPADVGTFALGLATTAPIFMFATLRLRDVQATDSKQEYLFGDYFALRLLTTGMAMLVVVGLVLSSGGQRETAWVILATGASKSVEAVSDAIYGLFMQQERLDRVAKSMMMKGPLSLLALGVAFALTRSVFWGVVGLTLARFVILAVYDFRSANDSLYTAANNRTRRSADIPRPRWHWPTLGKLVCLTMPLGVVTMLISFNINIPRYLIEWHFGAYELGIFAAVAAFQKTAPTVVQALGRSASPRLAKYYASNNAQAFTRLSLQIVAIGFALGLAAFLVAVVAGRPILLLLYGPEYVVPGLFQLIMLAAGIDYVATMLMFVITSARYYRIQLPLQLVSTAAVAVSCFWLVPLAGLSGAAYALIIGHLLRVAGCLTTAWHARRALDREDAESDIEDLALQPSHGG
jgi:O-antigen/teichoic acid export membrane protein